MTTTVVDHLRALRSKSLDEAKRLEGEARELREQASAMSDNAKAHRAYVADIERAITKLGSVDA